VVVDERVPAALPLEDCGVPVPLVQGEGFGLVPAEQRRDRVVRVRPQRGVADRKLKVARATAPFPLTGSKRSVSFLPQLSRTTSR
jgi:hypothetical protein